MKKYLGISLIILLGLLFRLIFINKPEGLWNDEYVSWSIASTPFLNGFWNAVKSQCHMPFYYLYLKFFMLIFGDNDLVLRLTSVLAGILAIPVMYLLGKENNEQTGYLCAGLTAISSFLIYYSQEVRLYSILFVFSALCILYTIRLIKSPNKKNFILSLLCNFLVLFTHTIGFVFVFFNTILISINIYKDFKKQVIYFWTTILAVSIFLAPLAIKIMTTKSFSQWWGHFSISKIGFLLTDYFSPVLTNLTNAPDNFFYAPKLLLFMLIPTFICIGGLIFAILKNKLNLQLFILTISVVSVLTIASISGKLVFITKYSIEIYPILIFLACSGLSEITNKYFKNTLVVTYILISLGYLIFYPYSAPKMPRIEGHKIVADMLNRANLNKNDKIILLYYPQERFEKYFNFSGYDVLSVNKGNFQEFISSNTSYIDAYTNGKHIYKDLFSKNTNKYYSNLINKSVFDKLELDQSVVLVILDSVSFYSPEILLKISQDETIYRDKPLLFLVFSYLKNKTLDELFSSLTLTHMERKGSWTIAKFTKLNNSRGK